MIKYTTKILLALSLLMFGGLTATYAQMTGDSQLSINIPNSFVLRDRTYPAGKYLIKPTDDLGDSGFILELHSDKGKTAAVFETSGVSANEAPKKSKLVFHKIGDQYFLSQIWVEGDPNGNQVEESKMEKELVAANKPFEEYIITTELKVKSKKVKTY